MKLPKDLEIAPGYEVRDWERLKLEPDKPSSTDWQTALKIFDARIRYRFLDPADVLIEHELTCSRKTFGFAILAIDCLVIETLQGFWEGKTDHKGKGESERLFTSFLKRWDAFTNCVRDQSKQADYAKLVYKGYRCALYHSGSTDGALRVGVSGRTFDFKNDHEVKVNRTSLHNNLKSAFETYLDELRQLGSSHLRLNFKAKMNAICGV